MISPIEENGDRSRSVWWPYAVAVVASVAALLFKLSLNPYLGDAFPFLTFFSTIMLSAWLGGMGPGLLATALSTTFVSIYFMDRLETPGHFGRILPLATFALEGVFISALSYTRRRALRERTLLLQRERATRVMAEEYGKRLNDVLESITDAFSTLDTEFRFTYVNRAACDFVSRKPDEMLGKNIWDVFPKATNTLFHAQCRKAMADRGVVEFEEHYPARDRWLRTRIYPTGDGLAIYAQDVTSQKRNERALKGSEALNTAVLRSALDCIILMDGQGKVVEWNAAAEKTFGYTRDEVLGQEMAELIIPPEMRGAHRQGLARYLLTGEGPVIGKRIEITAQRKDGSIFPTELSITPVNTQSVDGQGPTTFTGYLRDITDRKEAETERNRLLSAERDARHEAEKANRMKDEFLSIVSHELRTPLNAILGWSQILASRHTSAEDLKEGVDVIQRNAKAQTQIIDDILDMSRIISGKVRLDVQTVDLPVVIEAALDSMKPAAEAKGIALQKVIDPHVGSVSGDPARLQQVVWNLLSNAIKFTPKAGRVRVTLERVNSQVEISVSDNGEGIKPEFLSHVFERFRQGDSATTRRHGGLGLGLSIVKQLVELHGGSVQASSAGPGQGAVFRILLPLSPLKSGEEVYTRRHPKAHDGQPFDWPTPTLKGVKVLVIDDEPDARNLLHRLLEDRQAIVTTGSSVDEALALIATVNPDVIISDIGMPVRDGYELARVLRSLPPHEGGNTPAVALTAFARSEDRTSAMLAGFDVHVAKPVEPNELCAVVARLAGRGSA